jgi:hypothetical protein
MNRYVLLIFAGRLFGLLLIYACIKTPWSLLQARVLLLAEILSSQSLGKTASYFIFCNFISRKKMHSGAMSCLIL